MTGRVKFETSTTPRPLLADMVSNSTPPGLISREQTSPVCAGPSRDSDRCENQIVGHVYLFPVAKFRLDIGVALTNHFPIQNELPNWIYSSAFGDFPIVSFSFVAIVPSFPMLRSRRDDYHAWI